MIGLGTAALWATLFGASSGAPAVDSLVGPGPAVPFVAQGSRLCGGAAAAMLERFWGARGVYAEDYAHLVREAEGGIRTTDLELALRRRGYRVHVARGDPDPVLRRLREGLPAILLLGEASPPLHYVVLTAASDSEVLFHDPKLGPDRAASRTELLARWSASGYWALLAEPVPSSSRRSAAARRTSATSPVVHPDLVAALERMRAGDYAEAAALAEGMLEDAERRGKPEALLPSTQLARRLLATARFRSGDADGALDEWNLLSEPSIDLVDIRGAAGTRHDVLEAHIGLQAAEVLTSSSLAQARRRLADMPAVGTARIDYRPLPDGTVEVRGFVTEPATRPTPLALATQATQSLLDDRVEWEVGPFMGLGERWRLHGGWAPARRQAGSSVSAPLPWPRAVATVGIEWVRERHDLGGLDSAVGGEIRPAERLRGGLALRRWIAPRVRLDGGAWLERWDGSRRMVSTSISALSLLGRGEDVRLHTGLEAWTGRGEVIVRANMGATFVRSHARNRESRALLGGTVTSRSAPRTLWPGAGTGEIRAPLLRGHPLATGGAIRGAALAPRLLHATLEHRIFGRFGPLRLGGALFVDAARVSGAGSAPSARTLVDVGVGAFAAAGGREAMISLAAGARGPVLSARVGGLPAS